MSFAAVNFTGRTGAILSDFRDLGGERDDLPGLIPGAPGRAPQSQFASARLPDSLPQPTASGPTWQIAGKQFLLGIPNIARFLLNRRSEIVVAGNSEPTVDDLRIFTARRRLPASLLQSAQQMCCMAARCESATRPCCSAARRERKNRRMAAALVTARGFSTGNRRCLCGHGDRFRTPPVHPDGRQLKLWAQSIQ